MSGLVCTCLPAAKDRCVTRYRCGVGVKKPGRVDLLGGRGIMTQAGGDLRPPHALYPC